MSEFKGRNIAVIGLAATGLATARILRDLGATVRVYDTKPEAKLDAARVAEARSLGEGVTLSLGAEGIDWTQTDLVIPSPGVPRYSSMLTEALRREVEILGEIEVAYRLAKAPILAITGTNGKTTTTALLGAICREAGLQTWVAGNIAEDEGKRLPLIQAAVEAPADGVIVAEISSFQLEWVKEFRPKVGAWLNLTADHMDRHKDLEEYAVAKANLFRAQTPGDYAVLNHDDEVVLEYGTKAGQGIVWEFSIYGEPVEAGAYLHGDQLHLGEGGQILMNAAEVPIPGKHNIANVLAASAMALAFGIDREAIRAGVKSFKGVAHRMEPVALINDVRYINNSMCTNPAAVKASVSAVGGPLVAIVGGLHKGGDLSGMASALAKYARHIVLIGESKQAIADALRAAGLTALDFADTLPDAVQKASLEARTGDTVMLVPGCASFDMFTGFEQRGQVFRDAVRDLVGQEKMA